MSDLRLAVITMVMAQDFPHAASSLKSLEDQLDEQRHHFVLVNDEPDALIPLEPHQHRTVIHAQENLGVPKGRNRLIHAALEWGADLIMAFDDDLLAPSDHLDSIVREYTGLRREHANVGIFAPSLIDYHEARDLLYRESDARILDTGGHVQQRETYEVKRAIARRAQRVSTKLAFHMGVDDWMLHYLRPYGALASRTREALKDLLGQDYFAADVDYSSTLIKNRERARQRIATASSKPIPVHTLPGGVSCYSAELIRDLGVMEEAFSPFAFEDSEFSIRALRAGYRNFVLPGVVLVHDVQGRLRDRQRPTVIAARGKMRSLLIREHVPLPQVIPMILEATLFGSIDSWDRATHKTHDERSGPGLASMFQYLASLVHGAFRQSQGPSPDHSRRDLWRELVASARSNPHDSLRLSEASLMVRRGRITDPSNAVEAFSFDLLQVARAVDPEGGPDLALTVIGGVPTASSAAAPRLDVSMTLRRPHDSDQTELEVHLGLGDKITCQMTVGITGAGPSDVAPESAVNQVSIGDLTLALQWRRQGSSGRLGPSSMDSSLEKLPQVILDSESGIRIKAAPTEPVHVDEIRAMTDQDLPRRLGVVVERLDLPPAIPPDQRPDVLLAPHNGYHASEMLMIAEEISARGYRTSFVDITDSYRDEGARARLQQAGVDVWTYSDDLLGRLRPRALLVMNDWGGPPGKMVLQARRYETTSFALVEGVQDYRDTHVDHIGVGRVRSPYTHADVILLVGEDDRRHLPDKEAYLTGSSRMERLALEERSPNREPIAVINANFTYGVYSEQAREWVDQAVRACTEAGIESVISQHHADQTDLAGHTVSSIPLYDELRRASVFISRFSGAILEAMALDTPVIYFNPHGERVDKFQGDHGAFPIARTGDELEEALEYVLGHPREDLATRQALFFNEHVSIDPNAAVSQRVADVIESKSLRAGQEIVARNSA